MVWWGFFDGGMALLTFRGPDTVYVIADPSSVAAAAGSRPDNGQASPFLSRCRAAIEAGVDVLQLRAKDRPTRQVYQWAATLRQLTEHSETRFIVNDRLDVALAVGADGVHLGQMSLPVDVVRPLMEPEMVLGVSVHTVEEAERASGADYLLASPVFPTRSKPGVPAKGVDWFTRLQQRVSAAVLPLGGINPLTVESLRGRTQAGVAVMSAVMSASDVDAAVTALRQGLTPIEPGETDRGGGFD